MTITMILGVAILALMVIMMLSNKFAFGAPPLIACVLMVIAGCAPIEVAFSGFIDKNVIMIAGFMTVTAILDKTSLMVKGKELLYSLAGKGGYKNYVVLLLAGMISTFIFDGAAGYVLMLTLIASIPYNEKLPASKMLIPVGFSTGYPIAPIKFAGMLGMTAGMMEACGGAGYTIEPLPFIAISWSKTILFFIWALIGYHLLPTRPINDLDNAIEEKKKKVRDDDDDLLPAGKQKIAYIVFTATFVGMLFLGKLGEIGYVLPCLGVAVLYLTGCMNFKEVLSNLFSPMVLMIASVMGVAAALGETGFTAMVGDMVAGSLTGASPFVLLLVFGCLTCVSATLTGANIGSQMVFAPIGIATCISMGYNPIAMMLVISAGAGANFLLPIDGRPAMIYGMGHYKITEYWKFTVPMWIIQMLGSIVLAMILFPM